VGNAICAKCGTDKFVTINSPNSVNVNTIDSSKKIIVIAEGKEIETKTAEHDTTKITVCAKCGDIVLG